MAVSLVDRMKGFLLAPGETFRKISDEEPAAVYKYLAAIVVIEAVLFALVGVIFFYNNPILGGIIKSNGVADIGAFAVILILGFFTLFFGSIVFALWTHIWVYAAGGRKGVMTTIKAILYSLTPFMLIGWIPYVGWVIGIAWSFILAIIGIRELQGISTGRAAVGIILSYVIAIFLLVMFGLISLGIITDGLPSAPG